MRKFLVYSQKAHTSPIIRDLKSAGRIDILLHSIVTGLFASNTFREDTELHLVMMGPPTSPRHIFIKFHKDNTISKKNLKKLLEMALRRYKEGETREIHPGVFIDNKDVETIIKEFQEEGNICYYMNEVGEHIKSISNDKLENPVFILGDDDGFSKPVKKFLKKNCRRVSLGSQLYFTSQAITILHYELDNLEYNE